MIPADVKIRKEAKANENLKQQQLDGHLKEMPKKERVIAYTHQLFRSVAIEWLIATSQGDKVTGDINLTCDAWQASNTDGYFATTTHWIETAEGGG
ncbi:hypothetical protein PHLCEN_2v6794 [Hermanssonia centrifuga]|uniref:Uncharacterized protein n=1 Tax=Hermanssonia centrifuga TaxID=98765 RepID=A0A2R6NYD7_9APHY|nr:hypothetical protein PHLCEN_2v6794 [Hermanssonia centrifuga]